MNAMRAFFAKFQKDERGVTAIEYGLIAIAMAALLTAVFTDDNGFIGKLKNGFDQVGNSISTSSEKVKEIAKPTNPTNPTE
ncbi:Flp family type IVb pilin [Photobacterium leiognathi]|uniref:Flp family type IVb pilin n=1 Tax=Photobacterium leiognathi TaxID=553611 RepID=UPI002736E683|nr:Flp family type IVb pilin [Photobacterium leiognathi]